MRTRRLRAVHHGGTSFARFLQTNPDGGVWAGRRFTELEPVEFDGELQPRFVAG
jgi:hypothetical protein